MEKNFDSAGLKEALGYLFSPRQRVGEFGAGVWALPAGPCEGALWQCPPHQAPLNQPALWGVGGPRPSLPGYGHQEFMGGSCCPVCAGGPGGWTRQMFSQDLAQFRVKSSCAFS